MNYQARRLRVATDGEAPKQKENPEGLTIRQWAIHAVAFALEDWEQANSHVPKTSAAWKEYPFFFMRRMKSHPKLIHASCDEAAELFAQLWLEVEEVQTSLLRDNFGVDDIHAYVTRRWESITHLPGESPMRHAYNVTMTEPLVFKVPRTIYDDAHWGRPMLMSEENLKSPLVEVSCQYHDLCSTRWGLFLGVVWNLHKMLAKANPRPSLILSCDQLAEVLEVTSKTAWDYRCRLLDSCVAKKLPKQGGPADRFELIHPRFGCFLLHNWKCRPTKSNQFKRINLD